MRRTLRGSLVALSVSALFLTACSGGSSDGASGSQDEATKPGEKVELNFWAWAPEMDKTVEVWNESHPDIHVTVNKQDGGDPAVTKLLTATKAGSGAPDLMQAEYQALPTMVAAGALADIKGELSGEAQGHFSDGVWNAVTLGTDAVYAVPQDAAPLMFFYRSDVFDKLKIKVPTTWDEYAQAARTIHQDDKKKYLGTFSSNDAGLFAGLTQQNGASWWGIDGDAWSVNIDSDASRKVAQYWGGLVEEGVIDNTPMYTPGWNSALNKGTQVGWVSAVWAPGVLAGNAADTKGKWKVAPMPQWTAGANVSGSWGGSSTAVTSQSKHKAAAAQFAEWLNTSADGVKALATISNVYPADQTNSAAALSEPPAFFENQPDFYEVAAKIAGTTAPFTYGPNTNVAYSAFNDAFGKAAQSKSAAAFTQALTSMQTQTVEDLKSSGFTTK
ncbi:extracellular solute-binding protein [Kineosporia sp. NBRC 101731]|uniref:ABC transporter substrate-binding protein n=1 Tax=Kineosporia sp. NBRC 101731 TaxID=3032199 RepID=UPI0024A4448B|nr:extracellular solute-binding protein [Kineosporia sp. NBRC 101731]GLY31903.1 sugar ABC transporter substrate-binding protein [Kineosporia sp. NBRC 101731]